MSLVPDEEAIVHIEHRIVRKCVARDIKATKAIECHSAVMIGYYSARAMSTETFWASAIYFSQLFRGSGQV